MALREDTEFYPLLVELAGCLCTQLEAAGLETCFCGLVTGSSVDISRVHPDTGGQGWVRLASIGPLPNTQTGVSNVGPCGTQFLATIEVGYADCYPINDMGESLSLEQELEATQRLMAGAAAAKRAAYCCGWVKNKRRLQAGEFAPGGPEGGVIWGTWTVSVEVP